MHYCPNCDHRCYCDPGDTDLDECIHACGQEDDDEEEAS
jgi:hypothetical protein